MSPRNAFLLVLLLSLSFAGCLGWNVINQEEGPEQENFPSPFTASTGFVPPHYAQWTDRGDARPDDVVTVHIALKQRNLDLLSQIHAAISDPKSKDYGKVYTAEQVLALVAPPAEDVETVVSWIRTTATNPESIVSLNNYGDALKVVAHASLIERLFSTELRVYEHISGVQAIRQKYHHSYHLPEHISPLVDLVTGLSDFPHLQKNHKKGEEIVASDNYGYISPTTIRELYNVPTDLKGGKNPDNIQVALEFTGVGFPSTLDWKEFDNLANETFQNYSKIVHKGTGDDGESTLDVQYLTTVGANVSTWYWQITDGWAYEMALDIFNYPAPHPPVFSVSYGWPELDTCDSSITNANCTGESSYGYVLRANTEFQKTGLLRISFLICSQDEGAPSALNEGCELDQSDHPVFGIYPCSSPYVTCVSATTVGPETSGTPPTTPALCEQGYPCAQSKHEVPCSVDNTYFEWTTGGGFAEFSPRPSYQDEAVTLYLANKTVVPPANKFNNSMQRGYPDVATVGARILVIDEQQISVSAGTSASTPIFAGLVSLLNEYRLSNQKTALGFLNPLLYQMAAESPAAFNDITEGNNACTRFTTCCQYGFVSAVGWDAVTGLGTPNFEEMLDYVKTLN